MNADRLPSPHHFTNADGTCHAGDLFEHGTETTGVYLADDVRRIVAAAMTEAADAIENSGCTQRHCSCSKQQSANRHAGLLRNLAAKHAP